MIARWKILWIQHPKDKYEWALSRYTKVEKRNIFLLIQMVSIQILLNFQATIDPIKINGEIISHQQQLVLYT